MLTNTEFKVVERMLVDLLYAFIQSYGEVGQGTQMSPFVFTLLRKKLYTNLLIKFCICPGATHPYQVPIFEFGIYNSLSILDAREVHCY